MIFKPDEGAGHLGHVIAHLRVGRGRKVDACAGESGGHDVNCPRLHRPWPAGGFHIRQQRFLNTLFQHDGAQRETLHIQGRHQRGRANQPVNACLQRRVSQFAGQDRHFGHRHAAEVIEHHRQTAGFRQGGGQFFHHQVDDVRTVLRGDGRGARLAVDAHSQLGVTGLMARRAVGLLWQMAAGQRHPDAGGVVGGVPRFAQNGGEVVAAFGKIARHLMDEQRTGDAPRLFIIRQRNVVADDQHFHVVAETARVLRREAEVQPVAGIVFYDQQAARLAGHRLNGGKHRVDARRGEQIATDCGGQHAFTNKADVRRFVAGAAAGDHRHVVFIQVATDHHPDRRVALQPGEVIPRTGDDGSLNHVVDEAGALVKKELRHSGS